MKECHNIYYRLLNVEGINGEKKSHSINISDIVTKVVPLYFVDNDLVHVQSVVTIASFRFLTQVLTTFLYLSILVFSFLN